MVQSVSAWTTTAPRGSMAYPRGPQRSLSAGTLTGTRTFRQAARAPPPFFQDSDSEEVPGVSPRAASLGSASGPAPRPAPCPVGCGRAALPAFGWLRGQATGAFRPPRLHTCPGLRIVLKPGPGPSRPPRRSALLLPSGGSVVVQRYGTPRLFPCPQITSRTLTVRNRLELPTVLHFDEAHRDAVGEGWESRVVASPAIVEWLMGVLPGWTLPQPLAPSVVAAHALGVPSVGGVSAPAGGARRRTLSLFTGCGALDWALLDRRRPVA